MVITQIKTYDLPEIQGEEGESVSAIYTEGIPRWVSECYGIQHLQYALADLAPQQHGPSNSSCLASRSQPLIEKELRDTCYISNS